jgi:mono/diheme cytochrome c family protein
MRVHGLKGWLVVACVAVLATTGCRDVPGRPGPGSVVPRPDQVTDFKTLYSENCTACHGVEGHHGAAFSLANPAFLAAASVNDIEQIVGAGLGESRGVGRTDAAAAGERNAGERGERAAGLYDVLRALPWGRWNGREGWEYADWIDCESGVPGADQQPGFAYGGDRRIAGQRDAGLAFGCAGTSDDRPGD